MIANVGDDAYGALSVKIRYYGDGKLLGTVPPTVFVPRPDVDSAIIEITRSEVPRVDVDADAMFSLVRDGFGQRRKMLRSSLKGRVDESSFERAAIKPTVRAEELTVEDWARLTDALK